MIKDTVQYRDKAGDTLRKILIRIMAQGTKICHIFTVR